MYRIRRLTGGEVNLASMDELAAAKNEAVTIESTIAPGPIPSAPSNHQKENNP